MTLCHDVIGQVLLEAITCTPDAEVYLASRLKALGKDRKQGSMLPFAVLLYSSLSLGGNHILLLRKLKRLPVFLGYSNNIQCGIYVRRTRE